MKAKSILLVFFTLIIVSACKSDAKKETQPNTEPKETTVKTTPKPQKPEQPYVYGIDISSYQGDEIDAINSQKDTIRFVFSKATQGAFIVDPKFANNWSQAKKDGFIRGAYHFYMTANDPLEQAQLFAKTIGTLDPTDLPPVIDFEGGGIDKSQSVAEIQQGLDQFIEALEKELGRKPMIYTDIPTADSYLNNAKYAEYALWIANYTEKPRPDLPITWQDKGWTFWQRTDSYKLDSFTDDGDVFNGGITKLKDFIKNYQ